MMRWSLPKWLAATIPELKRASASNRHGITRPARCMQNRLQSPPRHRLQNRHRIRLLKQLPGRVTLQPQHQSSWRQPTRPRQANRPIVKLRSVRPQRVNQSPPVKPKLMRVLHPAFLTSHHHSHRHLRQRSLIKRNNQRNAHPRPHHSVRHLFPESTVRVPQNPSRSHRLHHWVQLPFPTWQARQIKNQQRDHR